MPRHGQVDAVGGDQLGQPVVPQKRLPHRDQGDVLPQGDLRRRVGVQLLVAIDHLRLPQPVQNAVPPQIVPAQEVQIPLPVNGGQGHHHRLHPALAQGVQGLMQGVGKLRQLRVGPVVGLGVRVNGGPVEVAVVAAVGHQGIPDGGPHFRPVHHLHQLGLVALHHLVDVKMIVEIHVRHRGLQQRISVNINLIRHGYDLHPSFFLI